MQQTDEIVAGWLSGSDSVDGLANPAGPLYIEGYAVTEAALTGAGSRLNNITSATTISCGNIGGCHCC